MDTYYWLLTLKDKTEFRIPPTSVEAVKAKISAREPINTANRVVMPYEVVSFQQTAERYTETPLLEAAAQAFKEPIIENDAIVCRFVKQRIMSARWHSHFSKIPGYRLLSDGGGMAEIGWWQPVHNIDLSKTDYANDYENTKYGQ